MASTLFKSCLDCFASFEIFQFIKQTGAYSPWANGLNERNHATNDIMMEKMLEDLPNVDENTALQYAVSGGNCCLLFMFVDSHLLN